eukprot:SM000012S25353  [mRNA]  locus=s12:625493:631871:+ [translate_table: standard]
MEAMARGIRRPAAAALRLLLWNGATRTQASCSRPACKVVRRLLPTSDRQQGCQGLDSQLRRGLAGATTSGDSDAHGAAVDASSGGDAAALVAAKAAVTGFDIPTLEALFSSAQESIGAHHAVTASVALSLGQAYMRAGHHPERALELAEMAWKVFDKLAGDSGGGAHGGQARPMCLHLMAAARGRMGQHELALEHLDAALRLVRAANATPAAKGGGGAVEQDAALMEFSTLMLQGDVHQALGRHAAALDDYCAALSCQVATLGPAHADVAATLRQVAEVHAHLLQFPEAQPLAERALRIHCRALGDGSTDEAVDRRLLAVIMSGQGDHEAALLHLRKVAAILAKRGRNLDIAYVNDSVGEELSALGRHSEALAAFEVAIRKKAAELGERHLAVACTQVAVAEACIAAGQASDAEVFIEKAVQAYGELDELANDPAAALEAAHGLTQLAGVHENIGQYDEAIIFLRKALALRRNIPGQLHAVASTLSQIGLTQQSASMLDDALVTFQECLPLMIEAFGANHSSIPIILNQMGLALTELGRIEEAVFHFQRASSLLNMLVGKDHDQATAAWDLLTPLNPRQLAKGLLAEDQRPPMEGCSQECRERVSSRGEGMDSDLHEEDILEGRANGLLVNNERHLEVADLLAGNHLESRQASQHRWVPQTQTAAEARALQSEHPSRLLR